MFQVLNALVGETCLRPFFDERDRINLLTLNDFVVVIHHGDLTPHATVDHLTEHHTINVSCVPSTARTLPLGWCYFRVHCIGLLSRVLGGMYG